MRKVLGVGVLALGVIGLSVWGRADHAARIETALSAGAQAALSATIHPVTATVSGRDITLVGLADTQAEQDRLVTALNDLRGRRVVNADGLRVLPTASPYVTRVEKAETGALSGNGFVPSERARALLGDAAGAFSLASGAPEIWADMITTGTDALALMDFGAVALDDQRLHVTGTVLGPDERDAVLAALAAFDPSLWSAEIDMRDDGTPAAFRFDWSASDGGTLGGKLPVGFSLEDIAARLQAGEISAQDLRIAALGAQGDMALWDQVAALLPDAEALTLDVDQTGARAHVGLGTGVPVGPVQERLSQVFDGAISVDTITPNAPDGTERVHALTGMRERLSGGYWIGVPDIAPSVNTCTAVVNDVLVGTTINFVVGSADLDEDAIFVLNRLGAYIRECTTSGGLNAEIGGHTDSTGSAELNLGLSDARAHAVRDALIARGAAPDRLTATGYGDTQPVADNETDEGRALNRRTTIVWSE